MCVIIRKPAGVCPPSKNLLKQAWDTNPDGAGFCVFDKTSNIIMRKGFMNFEDFYKNYKKYAKKENDIVIHFRIATSGGVSASMCHPFPIGNNSYLFHNGILSKIGTKTKSDTMILSEFLTKIELTEQKLNIFGALVDNDYCNKYGIITPNGVRLLGDYEELSNGLLVSNTYFLSKNSSLLPHKKGYNYYYNHYYDYDYDYDNILTLY